MDDGHDMCHIRSLPSRKEKNGYRNPYITSTFPAPESRIFLLYNAI